MTNEEAKSRGFESAGSMKRRDSEEQIEGVGDEVAAAPTDVVQPEFTLQEMSIIVKVLQNAQLPEANGKIAVGQIQAKLENLMQQQGANQ